ncbi:TPA: hypothetical protein HA278_07525 [Candidatus Woesearchaeota archaeon]|nr:hypothetical protein [archaeon]HIJ11880.1 hypothetical protein [Candidatus Woesearchaeota archaeon]
MTLAKRIVKIKDMAQKGEDVTKEIQKAAAAITEDYPKQKEVLLDLLRNGSFDGLLAEITQKKKTSTSTVIGIALLAIVILALLWWLLS